MPDSEQKYVLINANCIPMNEMGTSSTAIAVKDGRIVAVGEKSDVDSFVQKGWPVHDLGGQTLLPGFIDTHQHLGLTGQVLNGLNFKGVDCIKGILSKVEEAASLVRDGDWLLGYSLNEVNLHERRLPVKEELDLVCSDYPVMLVHSSWHLCALNSKALEVLDLPVDLPGMDIEDGTPTGLVRDPGALSHVFPAVSSLTPKATKLASFRAACNAAIKEGITSLHCLEGGEFGPGDTRLVVELADQLPLHAVVWNQIMDVDETLELGLSRIGGCICADGAMSAHTAALFEPYCDQPDNCGTLNFSQQQMDEFIMESHKAGLQVAIHCETDRAIEQVLVAMEKAIAAHPRDDHRHRIEHCEIPTAGQIERMAKVGIIAAMQPAFFPHMVDWDEYEARFGPERMRWLHPYRTMLDAGVVMCGGSDCPITPYSPLVGVQAAVLHPVEEERISVMEALRMFTIDAAFSGFEEQERGSIEPGKVADFVVLASDPTEVSPESIGDIEIVQVYINGVLV